MENSDISHSEMCVPHRIGSERYYVNEFKDAVLCNDSDRVGYEGGMAPVPEKIMF